MSYCFTKLSMGLDAAVEHTTASLKEAGSDIINEIDVRETFKRKLGIVYRSCRILAACNPRIAHEALAIKDEVSTMLSCNVVVQDIGGGKFDGAAMGTIENMALQGPAE